MVPCKVSEQRAKLRKIGIVVISLKDLQSFFLVECKNLLGELQSKDGMSNTNTGVHK